MDKNTFANDIKNPCPLNKFPTNKETSIQLNKDCEWINSLLSELHEGVTGMPVTEMNKRSSLDVRLDVTKKFNPKTGEYLLVKCHFEMEFFVNCVKTLTLMKDKLTCDFKSCFIGNEHEDDEMYADQIEVYMDNDLWDLHFYEKRDVDLKEIIHEQIYLNKNPYPTREIASDTSQNP